MRRFLPLILASLAFVAFAVLWIVTDRRAAQRVYDVFSSRNTSEEGLSLAAGYLAKQRKVSMLTKSVSRSDLERTAVIFRITEELPIFFDPEDLEGKQFGPPKPKETPLLDDAEEAFVRSGGRMIVGARYGLLESGDVEDEEEEVRKVFPIWPDVKELAAVDLRGFGTLTPRMHAIFTAGSRVVIARQRIGKGELFVLSAPEVLQNANLASGGHLALLSALAGEGRPVYFDEVLHGIVSDDGSLALMKEWNLGPFLLLLGGIAILVFWRHGRRIGPPDDEERDTRSDAIDLVRSLGALYGEVTNDAEAIAVYHDALTRTVAHQSGLRGEALHNRVSELTGGFVPPANVTGKMPSGVFKRQLEILNRGFEAHRLTGSQAHRRNKGTPTAPVSL